MKFLYFICLLILSNASANLFLQPPQQLSDQELEQLVQNWETQFTWNGKWMSLTCCYEQGQACLLLQLMGIPIRSYNFAYVANIKKSISSFGKKYYFEKPLHFEQSTPERINFDQLCNVLKNKNFIFYTGAGLSAGSVQTMPDLQQSLKIRDGKVALIKEIFMQPQTIAKAFSSFCESALYSLPTAAHYAIHEIAQRRNICILTENVDLLQQRTGSQPIFIFSDALESIKVTDLEQIDIILCIGLSHDDHGFLAHYKKINPQGTILAINLDIPHYLSDTDFIIQEDLQLVLPNLATIL